MKGLITAMTHSDLDAAIDWYADHFCGKGPEVLRGYVTGKFPHKQCCFADRDVLCHRNAYHELQMTPDGRLLHLPADYSCVQLGDEVVYSHRDTDKGTRAIQWIAVKNLIEVYGQTAKI